jgi:hypothetical protein
MCHERERLLDYLYDDCDAEERRRVERHLDACDTCRDEVSGLRAVRLNLLAWDVPEHGSVWKPFAPARVSPWYREIPVWALVAAASVMFLLGVAGGVASSQLVPIRAAAIAPAPVITPQLSPSPTSAEVAAMERRILSSVQAQIDRLQPVAAHPQRVAVGPSREELLRDMQRLLATSEQKQRQELNASMLKMLQDSQRTFVTNSRFNSYVNEFGPRLRYELSQAALQQGSKQ